MGRSCYQSTSARNDLKSHVSDGENNEGVSERQDEDTKGDAGYLRRRKRLLILEAVVSFGLVAALVIARLCDNKDKAQSAHCSSGTRMSSGKPDPGQSDHGHAARFHR